MNRSVYMAARRLIRDNGRSAYAWLPSSAKAEFALLVDIAAQHDLLAYRVATRRILPQLHPVRVFPLEGGGIQ